MLVTILAAGLAIQTVTFDGYTALPDGWSSGVTGHGAAKWEVIADGSATSAPNVLRQSGEATFCWAIDTAHKFKDGFAEVKIKPLAGKEDQAGGLVWRFKDPNNYYVVRANALEGNVVMYKTVDGKRSSLQVKGRMLGYGIDSKVPKGKWSTLRVEFAGNLFTVLFEGKKLFEVEDDTFEDEGAVGLWTKADSVTLFDDLKYGSK
jgi:hypothetical protein